MGKANTLLLLGVIGAVVAATILVIENKNKKPQPSPQPSPEPEPTPDPEPNPEPQPNQPVIPNFTYSGGVAVDNEGIIYVSDSGNNVVCKITYKDNAVNVTNLKTIFKDKKHPSFNNPIGLAVDSKRNVYVADTGNNLVRKIDTKGNVTNLGKIFKDKKHPSFNNPIGVAVDSQGNVYVADTGNKLVRKIDTNGVVTNLGKIFKLPEGYMDLDDNNQVIIDVDGKREPFFVEVTGVAVDPQGNVYVADTRKDFLCKIDSKGVITEFGKFLVGERPFITCVAVDSLGKNVYVPDVRQNKSICKLDAITGVVTNLGKNPGPFTPFGIAVDSAGNVYFINIGTNLLNKIDAKTGNVTTIY